MKQSLLPVMILILLGYIFSCSHSPGTVSSQAKGGEGGGDGEAAGADAAPLFQEDFTGFTGSGWRLNEGWAVHDEGGDPYLEGRGHSWAFYQRFLGADYRLTYRIKLSEGEAHLVLRYGQEGRYFITVHPHGTFLSKQIFPDTFFEGLAEKETTLSPREWYRFEITLEGDLIELEIDGKRQWSYRDPEPLQGSVFAFESHDGGRVAVDDIAVYGEREGLSAAWVRTGGPLGGLGYDVRINPRNPDVLYVTDAFAGIFRSEDGGESWRPVNTGINARTGESGDAVPVFSATIDPHDPDTLWAGTQDVRGIYLSENGGRSWSLKADGVEERHGISFRGFTVDPRGSDIVYASAELSSWNWAGEERLGREFDMTRGVVYKTTDGGDSWKPVWRGENLARYVIIDPGDPETLYLSTGIFDREAANSDPTRNIAGGEGVLKSTDGGRTWNRINRGIENLYVGSLFMHPENSEVLLAGAGNNAYPAGSGVYLTENGGRSWRKVLTAEVITSVEFGTGDPDVAYAGGSNAMYRSDDAGRSWRRVTPDEHSWGPPGIMAGFPIDFAVDPRDSDRIMVNNYGGGNFVSSDGGRTWKAASSGYTGAQMRDIAVVPGDPSHVYAVGRSGIFSSSDGGGSWEGRGFPPVKTTEWNAVAVDPSDPSRVLAASSAGNFIALSEDGGRSWRITAQNEYPRTSWRCIAFSPDNPDRVYAGSGSYFSAGGFDWEMDSRGIYRSEDGGESWRRIADPAIAEANVAAVLPPASSGEAVLAATTNRGVFRSEDGGDTWGKVTAGLPENPSALSLARKPDAPEVILLGIYHRAVYRSGDGGATWSSSGSGMNPEAAVTDIVFDPVRPKIVYASDLHSGVYRSEDGGRSWVPMNEGLRTRAVRALGISGDGSKLYAATDGEGVFRIDLSKLE